MVIVLAILTVLVVVSVISSPKRKHSQAGQAALDYVDQVRPLVERSQEAGNAVVAIRENAATLKSDAITREVARIESECQAVLTGTRGLHPPAAAEVANDLLVGAMAERLAGLKLLVQAMNTAIDASAAATDAVAALMTVGKDLVASDQSYQLFLDNLPATNQQAPDKSVWVPDDSAWTQPVLLGFVTSLRNSTNAAPVHDLAVLLLSTDPPVVNKEGAISVVPAEKTMQVQVVIADLGNRPEGRATLTIAITPLGATVPSDTARDFFDLLPGQRRSVVFQKLKLPNAGTPFSLVAHIGPVSGDANAQNDEVVEQYIVR